MVLGQFGVIDDFLEILILVGLSCNVLTVSAHDIPDAVALFTSLGLYFQSQDLLAC